MSQRFTPDSRPPGEPAETGAIGPSDLLVDGVADPAAPQPIDPAALANAQNTAPPDALLAIVVDTFIALADSTRTRILYALLRAPLCVRDLALLVDLSESAVSHHLRLLRDRRLVTTRHDGGLLSS